VRRVDVRTGADPSLRQTIVLLGVRPAIRWLIRVATPDPNAKLRRRQEELRRELERVSAEHSGDPCARQEAIMRVYRERGPMRVSCLPTLARAAPALLVERCPVPFLSQRRTLADLLAGTRIMRTGRSRSRWRSLWPLPVGLSRLRGRSP
jgi:hypothetical protein